MLILTLALILFYRQDFLPQAILSGDFQIPYPYSPLAELSSAVPWYDILSSFLYMNFYSVYGYVLNSLQVLLFIPAYATMYILLKEMEVRKYPAIILSMFYILNPVVLPSALSYNNLMWPEFFLFAPLFLFFIIKYSKSGNFLYLILLSALVSFYLEIQTAPLFYNIRLILPILTLPFLYVLVKRILTKEGNVRTVEHYAVSILLFIFLNLEPLLAVAGIASTTSSLATVSGSGFQSFHYNNVVYTYQSQNLFFAISGLVVYPYYQNGFLMGMGQIFLPITVTFVTLIVIAVSLSFARRGGNSGFRIALSVSALGIWAFISLTQTGYILPLFTRFPLLYLWEYPTYLESTLMVSYIPILSVLFINRNGKDTWIKSMGFVSSKTKPPSNIYKARNVMRLLVPFIVSILLLSYIAPMIATNSDGFSAVPSYDTQNPFYHDLFTFFDHKNGDYKVMIVPFNQTVYKELGAAVPDHNILALPYAYQNNPSAFANSTNFHDLYSDISTSQFGDFQLLLNNTGVKYIIALKTTNKVDNALNLSNLHYLTPVSNTSKYLILKYSKYRPVELQSDPFVLDTYSKNVNLSFDSELGKNQNFTNLSGYSQSSPFIPYWKENSSSLPYQKAFNFSRGMASIRVQGNSSNNTKQKSELIQRENVPGSASLNMTIRVLSQVNSYSYLYLIAQSNKSNNNFIYHKYLKMIAPNEEGNFSMMVTVPGNTQFVYFGVIVYNLTINKGTLNLSSLTLDLINNFNRTAYENAAQGELPFNSIVLPSANLSRYAYRSVLPLYPGDGILNISKGAWNYVNDRGIEISKSNISIVVPETTVLDLYIETFSGNFVNINGVNRGASFQGTMTVNSNISVVNISTTGNAVIKYAVLVSNVNAQKIVKVSADNRIGEFTISNTGENATIILTGSPLSSPEVSGNVSLIAVQNVNGVLEYLYVVMPEGSITYDLHVSLINLPMVIFNLTTFPIILGILVLGYYLLRKGKLTGSLRLNSF